ncbi:MAG: radical SAM protein, partial [Terriglobales bacterium]
RAPAEVAALEGVTLVAGNRDKAALPGWLAGGTPPRATALVPPLAPATRPTVQVQTGCGRACSFCIVPAVRGASASRALGEVVAEVEARAQSGAPEVVLSGINLGQWGRDRGRELTLATLIEALLRQTRIPRLRLSSLEPADWTPQLLQLLVAHAPRFARHLHLPLQSGSAAVLRRMRRRYRPRDYAALVETIVRAVPGCALGADVMAGFPGESEAEFDQTCTLLSSLPLAYLHVFSFSPRPGTEAARRLAAATWSAVPPGLIATRAAHLRQLDRGLRCRFRASQAGVRLEAVALAGGVALTDNYLELPLPQPAPPGARVWLEVPGAAA